ncbi:MAG: aspartate--tRNA ligase [Chloroflexi bacterium]|nr:aspartate--tRNA ligase [Chloroflexota bacterium]
MLRDTECGEPRVSDVSKTITLAGWVNRRRDHGNLIFIDLRDRTGLIQVVFNPKTNEEAHRLAENLRSEWVVQIRGEVVKRLDGAENPDLPTGDVEISASELIVLNPSKTPPFEIRDDIEVDDNTRLTYRYLDLRRPKMYANLELRHRVVKLMRDYLDERGFLEVETPILTKSTPEGARDYLVPSRVHPGQFYALPQSPQQLKQLLMVSGVDRYFQIARCFRDEDLRGDRQPEHTQLDLEMSFVEQEDILKLVEALYIWVTEKAIPGVQLQKPFPRMSYHEAIERFGSDKPDLRYGMELCTLSDLAEDSGFGVFKTVVGGGGTVRAFTAPGCGDYPRKTVDELTEIAKSSGAHGMMFIALSNEAESIDALEPDHIRSVIKSHVELDTIKAMANRAGAKPGDLILMIAGPSGVVNTALSNLRGEMARRLDLIDPNEVSYLFVLDFPLFELDPVSEKWGAMHHMFSSPRPEHVDMIETDPGAVIGQLYDLVCNGIELGSGSIRITDREIQERVFALIGYSREAVEERFGHLLRAFEYGAPPHGGAGLGIDRLLMALTGQNIREVVAFPKTQTAVDPLFEAPSRVEDEQLEELGIVVRETAK